MNRNFLRLTSALGFVVLAGLSFSSVSYAMGTKLCPPVYPTAATGVWQISKSLMGTKGLKDFTHHQDVKFVAMTGPGNKGNVVSVRDRATGDKLFSYNFSAQAIVGVQLESDLNRLLVLTELPNPPEGWVPAKGFTHSVWVYELPTGKLIWQLKLELRDDMRRKQWLYLGRIQSIPGDPDRLLISAGQVSQGCAVGCNHSLFKVSLTRGLEVDYARAHTGQTYFNAPTNVIGGRYLSLTDWGNGDEKSYVWDALTETKVRDLQKDWSFPTVDMQNLGSFGATALSPDQNEIWVADARKFPNQLIAIPLNSQLPVRKYALPIPRTEGWELETENRLTFVPERRELWILDVKSKGQPQKLISFVVPTVEASDPLLVSEAAGSIQIADTNAEEQQCSNPDNILEIRAVSGAQGNEMLVSTNSGWMGFLKRVNRR